MRRLLLAAVACTALGACDAKTPARAPEPPAAASVRAGGGAVLAPAEPDPYGAEVPPPPHPGAAATGVPSPATPNPYAGVSTRSTQDDLLLLVGAFVGVAGVTALMVGLTVALTSVQSAAK